MKNCWYKTVKQNENPFFLCCLRIVQVRKRLVGTRTGWQAFTSLCKHNPCTATRQEPPRQNPHAPRLRWRPEDLWKKYLDAKGFPQQFCFWRITINCSSKWLAISLNQPWSWPMVQEWRFCMVYGEFSWVRFRSSYVIGYQLLHVRVACPGSSPHDPATFQTAIVYEPPIDAPIRVPSKRITTKNRKKKSKQQG